MHLDANQTICYDISSVRYCVFVFVDVIDTNEVGQWYIRHNYLYCLIT